MMIIPFTSRVSIFKLIIVLLWVQIALIAPANLVVECTASPQNAINESAGRP
jgi:hypothetical protein